MRKGEEMNDIRFKKGILAPCPDCSGPSVDPAWERVKHDFPTAVKIVKTIKSIFTR